MIPQATARLILEGSSLCGPSALAPIGNALGLGLGPLGPLQGSSAHVIVYLRWMVPQLKITADRFVRVTSRVQPSHV